MLRGGNNVCRPRPGRDTTQSPEDVQRFYIIMLPISRHAPVRLMTVGTAKRMPDRGERFWGAVLETAAAVCICVFPDTSCIAPTPAACRVHPVE